MRFGSTEKRCWLRAVAGNTLTVTRGINATTPAAHATGDLVINLTRTDYEDEVAFLNGLGVTNRAFAVGTGAALDPLRIIDPTLMTQTLTTDALASELANIAPPPPPPPPVIPPLVLPQPGDYSDAAGNSQLSFFRFENIIGS